MMPGMFSLPGELPGRLVAKVVDRLGYVSFPFVCTTCRKLYNLPSQLQIDKVPSKLEDPRTDTRRHPLREGLLPECDLRYKCEDVVSSGVRLRGIAAEDEVRCFIPGNRDASCCNLIDGSKPTLTSSTAMNLG